MRARLLLLFLVSALPLSAQQSPFLPDDLYSKLVNEISGEIAHEHMRFFTHHHRPMGGSPGFEAVARYVETKAREYGLEDVRYIKQTTDTPSWYAKEGELWLLAPERKRLAFAQEVAISLADYSRTTNVSEAELVDVSEGTSEADYAGRNVAGKVILAHGSPGAVMEQGVWKRGALGIVYFSMGRTDFPDQIPWTRIPVENKEKTKKGTFAFVLSQREGLRLRRQLAMLAPKPAKGGEKKVATDPSPFKVSVKIASTFVEPPSQAIVEGVIRGSEIHDQDIVLTAHLQEELFSANDDASGCASVLEIARALKRLIDSGQLPRPRRDIRFWWADEISAEEQYFSDHPDERLQFIANINQDMVGAKQSLGGRIQFVTRPPWSRASYLGDVVESIVESLVLGNTSFLAAGQARQVARGEGGTAALTDEDPPFSRPILSRLGTRERYDARVIPFHNNTDHQVFNIGIIGIPAVTFTNWPDDYIHSSDDDLWQMDRTQLRRNAVAVAAAAWYLASFDDDDLPTLLTEMYGRGEERVSKDVATAMRMLERERSRPDAYTRAANLAEQSVLREQRAIDSLRRISSAAAFERLTAGARALFAPGEATARIANHYRLLSGDAAPTAAADKREAELSTRLPQLVSSVKQYLDGRKDLQRPKKLHALMAYEVLNFVDGKRSYADIYRAVSAEADSAGAWYYGSVTLEDVAAYLDSAEKAGMITVKK